MKLNVMATLALLILGLGGCNSGSSTQSQTPTIQFTVSGTQELKSVVGGSRDVEVLIKSSKSISNFTLDNLQDLLAANPAWSLVEDFNCQTLDADNPCKLSLEYAPTSLQHSGQLVINYSYDANNSTQKNTLQRSTLSTSTTTGSTTLSYSATSTNNVNAIITPVPQIQELVGLTQEVAIAFTPDNQQSASNLQITTGLSTLAANNSGWKGPPTFSCTNFKNSCILNLTYAPTSSSQKGTVNLSYSYTSSDGTTNTANIAIPYSAMIWGDNYSTSKIQYITASTIESLNSNVSSVHPAIESSLIAYLGVNSSLGYLGPISQLGPLGPLGPIGTNLWNPSAWISGAYSWNSYFSTINGPLSTSGPLGQNGPYTSDNYYQGDVFSSNQFAANTRAFGLWSILGPIGPLGAVGALGPLGPIGATGLVRNPLTGEFVNGSGSVIRSLNVPYSANSNRSFDVYENYTQSFAAQMTNNDTSFMVEGSLGFNASNSYTINSSQDQIVTVLAVPDTTVTSDIIYVGVYTTAGKLIALSNSNSYINYVEFTAPKGSYVVKITKNPYSLSPLYRLYVTGSYSYLNQYYIQGNYIKTTAL